MKNIRNEKIHTAQYLFIKTPVLYLSHHLSSTVCCVKLCFWGVWRIKTRILKMRVSVGLILIALAVSASAFPDRHRQHGGHHHGGGGSYFTIKLFFLILKNHPLLEISRLWRRWWVFNIFMLIWLLIWIYLNWRARRRP